MSGTFASPSDESQRARRAAPGADARVAKVRMRGRRAGNAPGGSGISAELTTGTGWTIFSYLIAGMLAYGGIGWLIGRFAHIYLLFPIGMLVGLAISIGWIIYRYGRPHELGNPPKGDDR